MLLSSTGPYSIGCEISERSIKLVQLKRSGRIPRLISIAHTELKEGIVVNGRIENVESLAGSIKSMVSKIVGKKLYTHEVVLSLPDSQTFIKSITIDPQGTTPEERIEKEIHKHFPLETSEAYFDHQILKSHSDGRKDVIISAVAKEIADPYLALAKSVGWHLLALELESVATAQALLGKNLDKNALIINLGYAHSSLVIVSDKTIPFTLSLPISGKTINEIIAHKLKLRTDQAEKAKIKCGLDEEKCKGALKIILDSILDDIAFKIDDALAYYEEHSHDSKSIENIIITGGGAHLINIENVLSVKLKRPVKKSDTLEFIKPIDKNLLAGINNKALHSYVTPIGLALRNIYTPLV